MQLSLVAQNENLRRWFMGLLDRDYYHDALARKHKANKQPTADEERVNRQVSDLFKQSADLLLSDKVQKSQSKIDQVVFRKNVRHKLFTVVKYIALVVALLGFMTTAFWLASSQPKPYINKIISLVWR